MCFEHTFLKELTLSVPASGVAPFVVIWFFSSTPAVGQGILPLFLLHSLPRILSVHLYKFSKH